MDIVSHNRRPWVLVVDDHDLSRQFTVQALRQITYRVKQARTGRDGLRMTIRYRPELIFLDLHLPDTDGIALLEQIRAGWPGDLPEPGYVILSGDPAIDLNGIRNLPREIALVTKPASSGDIQDLASRHLSGFRSIREVKVRHRDPVSRPAMRHLFLQDLETRCPMLDKHISALDWQSAQGVLHQMVAASAICREAEVERHCRLLNEELASSCRPKLLSQAYFGLLQAIERSRQGSHT